MLALSIPYEQDYFSRGWAIVPVQPKGKKAAIEWSNGSYKPYATLDDAIAACANLNIGIALGTRSGNLNDIDFDNPIAEKIAYLFLPETRTFGHGDRPISHRIYYTDKSSDIRVYYDVGTKGRGNKGKKLIEWRANGCMTVFPGSIHESGEPIEWHNPDTAIATIEYETLQRRLGQLHAATLFAMRTEDGTRHDGAMSIGGWLARAGYPLDDAILIVKAIAKARGRGGEKDSVDAVRDSYSRYEDGDTVYGRTTLDDMYGASVVKLAAESLGISAQPRKRKKLPDFPAIEGVTDTGYDCNDTGNARRFCALYGGDIRYRVKRDQWLVWGDEGWRVDETGAMQRLAVDTIERIKAESAATTGDRKQDLAEWAILSGNMPRRNALIEAVKHVRGISVVEDEIDQKHALLKLKNATINLETGIAYPHERDDLLVKRTPIVYAEDADCPEWHAFLARIIPSQAVRDFLQRAVGYSLTGYTREHLFFLLYGIGANGKSTFLKVITGLLGECAVATQMATLTTKIKAGGHSDEIASMSGARIVTVSEAPESVKWNAGIVKQLVSEDMVRASFKGEQGFDYTPTHKLWLALNHRPDSGDDSDGFWRRMSNIPFDVQIPEGERDAKLIDRLLEELPGILNWAIEGAVLYHREGRLIQPEEVTRETKNYRLDSDKVARWLEYCTIPNPTNADTEYSRTLYQSFSNWLRMSGEKDESERWFSQRLQAKGYKSAKDRNGMLWSGIRLTEMQQDIANAVKDNNSQDTRTIEHTFVPYSE